MEKQKSSPTAKRIMMLHLDAYVEE